MSCDPGNWNEPVPNVPQADTDSVTLQLSIDRFEDAIAVLATEDGRQIEFPRDLLPTAAKAGEILDLRIERDAQATRKLRQDTDKANR